MKNNADCLRRIASSVKNLADEIVVVCDDPVFDDFQSAAVQCGARLIPHRWQNDFAAARNVGLQAAHGDWIFWTDSDETLVAPNASTFRELLQRPEMLAYYVTIQDQTDGIIMSPRQHPSLYRRRNEIRYFGRIHEHFEPPLEVIATRLGMKVSSSPVRLTHTGYQLEKRPRKLERNIALLELELADRPGQFYYLVELGRSLLLSGQSRGHLVLNEAAKILIPTIKDSHPPNPLAAAFLEYALTHAPADFLISRDTAVDLILRWFPFSPPLIWLAARRYYEQGKIAEAAQLLQQLLDLGKEKNYDHLISFDQSIFGDEARLNLGVCYAKLGQIKKAIAQFSLIKANSRFYSVAQQNIKQLQDV
jgi:glycosyltransferase involved in cell wall biosynthesis